MAGLLLIIVCVPEVPVATVGLARRSTADRLEILRICAFRAGGLGLSLGRDRALLAPIHAVGFVTAGDLLLNILNRVCKEAFTTALRSDARSRWCSSSNSF